MSRSLLPGLTRRTLLQGAANGAFLAVLPRSAHADDRQRGCDLLARLHEVVTTEITAIDAWLLIQADPVTITRWQDLCAEARQQIWNANADASAGEVGLALGALGMVAGVGLLLLGIPAIAGSAALSAVTIMTAGIATSGTLLVTEAVARGTVSPSAIAIDVPLNRTSGIMGVFAGTVPPERVMAMSTRVARGAGNLLGVIGILVSALRLASDARAYSEIVANKDRLVSFLARAEDELAALADTGTLRRLRLESLTNLRDDLEIAIAAGCNGIQGA